MASAGPEKDRVRDENEAWRKLLVRLGGLRGHPKMQGFLEEKHQELLDLATDGPEILAEPYSEKVNKWFHSKLKGKECSKMRTKLCNKLIPQLKEMSDEILGADLAATIEKVNVALTQGTADEGPLVCSILAKELEGTRFEGQWLSKDGKGKYKVGEDGMKVAVQVLDGKLLIHGYFEGTFLHPVRVPIKTFLTENGSSAKKGAIDDIDFFGSLGGGGSQEKAGSAAKGNAGASRGTARSRSPKQTKAKSDANSGMPPGWVKRESRSKPGTYYYAHEATGKSQLDKPTA